MFSNNYAIKQQLAIGHLTPKQRKNKSYDDSVKLKRTEMDHFRFGLGLGNEARLEPEREPERA